MRSLLLVSLLSMATGCGICDRWQDRRERDRDLPPRDDEPLPRFGFIGPSREAPPINPPIPELPPQREFTAPRAEDPSWRNR
jgi:hypothetical protein